MEKMNVKPGGSQPKMHNTTHDRPQSMQFPDGTPKGMAWVLQEQKVDIRHLIKVEMKPILKSHLNFKDEKTRVE